MTKRSWTLSHKLIAISMMVFELIYYQADYLINLVARIMEGLHNIIYQVDVT